MQKLVKKNLGSDCLYEFQCQDDGLITEVLEQVKESDYKLNAANSQTIVDDFFHSKLFDWFDSCIELTKSDIQIPKCITLPITICWANKTSKLQSQQLHAHGNSFMSGIFYLTDGHEGGDTIFTCNNPWFEYYKWIRWSDHLNTINFKYTPKKGTLLLFPSYMPHRVTPVKDTNIRYSIAFNTFFAGAIADTAETKTKLILHPNTVREQHET